MKEYDELDFSYISSDYYCPRQLNLTSYNLYFSKSLAEIVRLVPLSQTPYM